MRIWTFIRKKARDESGVSSIIVYLLFLPVYLAALGFMFEVTNMHAIKNSIEVACEMAAYAGSRQLDYELLQADIVSEPKLITSNDENRYEYPDGSPFIRFISKETAESTVFGAPVSDMSVEEIMANSDLMYKIETLYTTTDQIKVKNYRYVPSESIAKTVLAYNLSKNSIAAPNGARSNDIIDGSMTYVMTMNQSTEYYDRVLKRYVQAQYPSVYVSASIVHNVNPLLSFATLGIFDTVVIQGEAVAQVVPSLTQQGRTMR